ncbi:MAG: lysylphosphatidylglycerol synthase transmembrane domain-containing protein, partial [Candidatus Syntropharchaeia archaeon]
ILTLVVLSIFILITFNLGYVVYLDILIVIFMILCGLLLLRSRKVSKVMFNVLFRLLSLHPRFRDTKGKREEISEKFHSGFRFGKFTLLMVSALSLLIWISEGLIFYLAFLSLGIEIPLLLIISVFAFSVLMGVITFLPGGIGSTEFVFALVLSNYMPLSQATAGIILGRFLTFWLIMLIAGVFWRKI